MTGGGATSFVSARRLFLAGAIGLTLWLGATFVWHVTWRQGISLPVILFLDQDFPLLIGSLLLLALAAPFAEGRASACRARPRGSSCR